MPIYQSTGATQANSWVIGSVKAEVAASALASYTTLGLGREFTVTENIEKQNVQADNGPDVVDQIGRHTVTITFTLLEFYLPTIDSIRGGIDSVGTASIGTYITSGSVHQLTTGGLAVQTPKAYKFTNSKLVSGATVSTVVVVYSTTIEQGLALAFQSDNADDPVMPIPFTLMGELDTSRTTNDQLMVLETQIGI